MSSSATKQPSVDLVWLAPKSADGPPDCPPDWPLGRVVRADPSKRGKIASEAGALVAAIEKLDAGADRYLLTWDPSVAGLPDPASVTKALALPGELCHAGLRLGQGGRPGLLDFVHPTWMPNLDPPAEIAASSWRLSLRACLLPAGLWRRLGGPSTDFDSLDMASLDLGWRALKAGVLCRHVPWLVAAPESASIAPSGLPDELRFAHRNLGRRWTSWACVRAVITGTISPLALWRARRALDVGQHRISRPEGSHPDGGWVPTPERPEAADPRVTVLIPTLDRYDYLRVILGQLAEQTVQPHEVIVVDQTEKSHRNRQWLEGFQADAGELRCVLLEQDEPGQCSSRNRGLRAATGDAILFLDDDDEIEPDLIELHLRCLRETAAEASCGVADEAGAGEPPGARTEPGHRRLADVFPTNNSMVLRSALERSGLFDLAYERGARADLDLGIRLYRTGASMVLDPTISVFHHRAPRGGLRRHRARKITYSASRRSLWVRHLPSPTELYLQQRYFSPRQCREANVLRLAGTFAIRGGPLRRLAKALVSALLLPHSWLLLRRNQRLARALAADHPTIPSLEKSP